MTTPLYVEVNSVLMFLWPKSRKQGRCLADYLISRDITDEWASLRQDQVHHGSQDSAGATATT